MATNVKLGSIVKDRITGFEGVAIGRHEYLTGCNKVTVQPQGLDKDLLPRKAEWFDEQCLVIVQAPVAGAFIDQPAEAQAPTGGPDEMPRRKL